jgi:hypothetical protein
MKKNMIVLTDAPPRASDLSEWLWQQVRRCCAMGLWCYESPAEGGPLDGWKKVRVYPMTEEGVGALVQRSGSRWAVCMGASMRVFARGVARTAARALCVWTDVRGSAAMDWPACCVHVCLHPRVQRVLAASSHVYAFDVLVPHCPRPSIAWCNGMWPDDQSDRLSLIVPASHASWATMLARAGYEHCTVLPSFAFDACANVMHKTRTAGACAVAASCVWTCVAALWTGVPVLCLSDECASFCGACGIRVPLEDTSDVVLLSHVLNMIHHHPEQWQPAWRACNAGSGRSVAEAYFQAFERRGLEPRQKYVASFLGHADCRARVVVGLVGAFDASGMGAQLERYVEALRQAGVEVRVLSYTGYASDRSRGGTEGMQRVLFADHVDVVPLPREHVSRRLVYAWCHRYGITNLCVIEPIRGVMDEWCDGARAADVRCISAVCNAEFLRPGDVARWRAANVRCFENWPGAVSDAGGMDGVVGMGLRSCCGDALERRACAWEEKYAVRAVGVFVVRCALVVGACAHRKRARSVVLAFCEYAAQCAAARCALTVCTWKDDWLSAEERVLCDRARVEWVVGQQSEDALKSIRERCDVAICVSMVEGLGMELYDACESGQLLLVHDKGPHGLFADPGSFGWRVDASEERGDGVGDRGGACGVRWDVNDRDIVRAFHRIDCCEPHQLPTMLRRARHELCRRFCWSDFVQRVGVACGLTSERKG